VTKKKPEIQTPTETPKDYAERRIREVARELSSRIGDCTIILIHEDNKRFNNFYKFEIRDELNLARMDHIHLSRMLSIYFWCRDDIVKRLQLSNSGFEKYIEKQIVP